MGCSWRSWTFCSVATVFSFASEHLFLMFGTFCFSHNLANTRLLQPTTPQNLSSTPGEHVHFADKVPVTFEPSSFNSIGRKRSFQHTLSTANTQNIDADREVRRRHIFNRSGLSEANSENDISQKFKSYLQIQAFCFHPNASSLY
nr:hypothetical protein [Tanacetum cinerariifolium]